MLMPNWGTSRSRKVRMNAFLHAKLDASESASHERGNPPRSQRCCHASFPTSSSEKPCMSIKLVLPARVSDTPRTSAGDALPRRRNRAVLSGLSARTRRTGKSSGRRCTSSMITNPRFPASTSMGFASAASSAGSSRSKKVAGVLCAMIRAMVVLPHWRGPSRVTTGAIAKAFSIRSCSTGRGITVVMAL